MKSCIKQAKIITPKSVFLLDSKIDVKNGNIDEMNCCAKESHLFHIRDAQTTRSKMEIGEDYVCIDSYFAMNGHKCFS